MNLVNPLSFTRALTRSFRLPAAGTAPSAEAVDLYSVPHAVDQTQTRPAPASRAAEVTSKPVPSARYDIAPDGKTHAVSFTYDPDGHDLQNLTLVGSWDNATGHYSTSWDNSSVAMTKDAKGVWHATVQVLDDASHPWQWGVRADGPTGKQQFAMFDEENPTFEPQGPQANVSYAPSRLHSMGMTHDGADVGFKYWAPYAQDVKVRVWGDDATQYEDHAMQQDPATGNWSLSMPGGWASLQGKNYGYEITTREGTSVLRSDPYGRMQQGQQRGIAQVYLAARTGQEVNPYYVDSVQQQKGQPSFLPFIRFEVQGHSNATDVTVTLRDDAGHAVTKDELTARLGACDASLVGHYHNDKFNDFYQNNIDSQGRIHLTQQGGAWGALVNNPQALAGLHYRIEVTQPGADGKPEVVGDADHDGQVSAAEARKTAFNDPYSDVISPNYGWNRYNVIADPQFDWKNDNAPRMATAPDKMKIYQLHVGSFMGDAQNVHRSNFNDVVNRLQYLKDLGINTLEMLPTNAYEGMRDWGYVGTNSMAVADQYGFEDKDGTWVSGREALCKLIDTAHGMGFGVYNDVVYNHWGLNYNDMWNTDSKQNPYFDWGTDPNASPTYIGTPFGNLPAYNKEAVRQFAVDSVMQQLDELHYDDLRFDFTNPIHSDGGGGGEAGWTLLRKINREVHFFHPKDMTNAEEFPNSTVITEPAQGHLQGGAGFDTMWDTEYQHALVHRNGEPPGVLQQAAGGQYTNMDNFMNDLLTHPGFQNVMNQVTIISNHDEVGNADRTINVAMNGQPYSVPSQWARNVARLSFGVGMMSPGIPLYFQGEESLAKNRFSWDVPTTWDLGWDWLKVGQDWNWKDAAYSDSKRQQIEDVVNGKPPAAPLSDTDKKMVAYLQGLAPEARAEGEYNIMRHNQYNFATDITHLRDTTPAFDGDASVQRVYTHNDNKVMAFSRQKGNDQYLVVASLNQNNLSNYTIPTDGGQWQLVMDSDAPQYGGTGFGQDQTVNGGSNSQFNIPAGGMLVFKKVS